jgi:ribose transport system ATP-binding protein
VINCLEKYCKGGLVQTKQINDVAEEFEHKFNIKTSSLDQMVKNLSGGNQQKVVLAKTMAANSEVIIFDEPTRGIDVGAKQEIYELMNELVSEGKAILMVSSDMPELLGMCDRIVVIAEGKQTGILNKDEFDQEKVLELASISAIS